jgi:hypothetical protein
MSETEERTLHISLCVLFPNDKGIEGAFQRSNCYLVGEITTVIYAINVIKRRIMMQGFVQDAAKASTR